MLLVSPSRSLLIRIALLIAITGVVTAASVLVIHAITGSWVTGAVIGGISGGITAATYPVIFRRG